MVVSGDLVVVSGGFFAAVSVVFSVTALVVAFPAVPELSADESEPAGDKVETSVEGAVVALFSLFFTA